MPEKFPDVSLVLEVADHKIYVFYPGEQGSIHPQGLGLSQVVMILESNQLEASYQQGIADVPWWAAESLGFCLRDA